MDQTEDRKLSVDAKLANKKTYRKPTVQVYGTLSELTLTHDAAPTKSPDGGTAPMTAT